MGPDLRRLLNPLVHLDATLQFHRLHLNVVIGLGERFVRIQLPDYVKYLAIFEVRWICIGSDSYHTSHCLVQRDDFPRRLPLQLQKKRYS